MKYASLLSEAQDRPKLLSTKEARLHSRSQELKPRTVTSEVRDLRVHQYRKERKSSVTQLACIYLRVICLSSLVLYYGTNIGAVLIKVMPRLRRSFDLPTFKPL